MKLSERPIYTVKFRPEPGADAVRSLRRLLKSALRLYRLRCIDVRDTSPNDDQTKSLLANSDFIERKLP